MALLSGAAAALPLFLNSGFLNTRAGGDSPFLLFRLHQLYAAISQGVFPVRWMPDAAYGLGFPFFNYYSALPYYFAAGLKAFGFGYVISLKLTQLAGFLVAAWAMYGWVRAWGGEGDVSRVTSQVSRVSSRGAHTESGDHTQSGAHTGAPLRALLASAAYTFAPFHLANVYVRGDSLSEFWAFTFYPLILWAALRLRQKPDFNRALALGLAYAALILTHNISALIFTPFLLIYLLLLAAGHGSKIQDTRMQDTGNAIRTKGYGVWNTFHASRFTLHASFSLLLALALSAFYWLPALGESGYVQLGAQTTGFFFYGNHFRRLSADLHAVDSFVQPGFFFDYDITLAGTSPFSMGLVQTVLLAAALAVLAIRLLRSRASTGQRGDGSTGRRGDGVTGRPVTRYPLLITGTGIGFLLLGLALSTFMVLPISAPLWANLPLLPLVQFPWRFLSVQSLFVSALIVYGLSLIADRRSRVTFGASLYYTVILLVAIALASSGLGGLRPDFVRITDGDVTPDRLQLYEYFTGNIGTTIRAEYLPEAVIPRPYTSDEFLDRRPRVKVLAGEAEGQRLEKRAASQTWHIAVPSSAESATVAVPLHYFPGWKATAGGQPLPITAAPGLGYIQFELPPGDHVVELKLGRTPLRAAAEILSLLALLGVFGIAAALTIGRSHLRISPKIEHETPFHVQFRKAFLPGMFAAALALLLALALSALLPESGEKGQSLTADFNQQAYHSSAPVRYDTGARLEAYDYDKDHIRPGETLSVRINPQDPRETGPAQGSLRLVTPAAIYLNATSEAGSLRQAFHLSPDALAQIKLPADLPSGVYLPELNVEGAESLTSSGRPRGVLYLAPVFVDGLGEPHPRPPPLRSASGAMVPGAQRGEDAEPHPRPLPETERGEDAPALATFGPAIELMEAALRELAPGLLMLSLRWRAAADVPQNYALALRLHDVVGNEWYALDTQPAYGFYPTGMWLPGEVIPDSFEIRLPDGLPPSAGYNLGITLYDAGNLQPIGSFDLPVVLSLATLLSGRQTRFQPAPEIGLEGVEQSARVLQGAALVLDARWLVLQIPAANYTARWTLSGPAVYVADAGLAPGSPPTTWQADSFILGRAAIPIPPDLPPGMYTLSLQLLSGPDRPAGNVLEVGIVEVTGRERVFAAPPVSVEMGTTFGDQIKLWGYDLSREANTLALTVQWGALARPEKDYNFFLHLVGAEDVPAAQLDSMPRNYTYPTSLWLPGEVVSDTLTLDLQGVPPGDYRLALGWYDPTSPTLERLAAFDAEGKPLEGERVVLEEVVKVR